MNKLIVTVLTVLFAFTALGMEVSNEVNKQKLDLSTYEGDVIVLGSPYCSNCLMFLGNYLDSLKRDYIVLHGRDEKNRTRMAWNLSSLKKFNIAKDRLHWVEDEIFDSLYTQSSTWPYLIKENRDTIVYKDIFIENGLLKEDFKSIFR